eukprot:PhM_4_TR9169/c0_g1_i1/m.94474
MASRRPAEMLRGGRTGGAAPQQKQSIRPTLCAFTSVSSYSCTPADSKFLAPPPSGPDTQNTHIQSPWSLTTFTSGSVQHSSVRSTEFGGKSPIRRPRHASGTSAADKRRRTWTLPTCAATHSTFHRRRCSRSRTTQARSTTRPFRTLLPAAEFVVDDGGAGDSVLLWSTSSLSPLFLPHTLSRDAARGSMSSLSVRQGMSRALTWISRSGTSSATFGTMAVSAVHMSPMSSPRSLTKGDISGMPSSPPTRAVRCCRAVCGRRGVGHASWHPSGATLGCSSLGKAYLGGVWLRNMLTTRREADAGDVPAPGFSAGCALPDPSDTDPDKDGGTCKSKSNFTSYGMAIRCDDRRKMRISCLCTLSPPPRSRHPLGVYSARAPAPNLCCTKSTKVVMSQTLRVDTVTYVVGAVHTYTQCTSPLRLHFGATFLVVYDGAVRTLPYFCNPVKCSSDARRWWMFIFCIYFSFFLWQ